ncbi:MULTISPECIES: DUF4160 domain-containing protein [unclassified Pseudomonas]|uniref:DUF4160 domain-containing protein n=2 Tax=unclassified Pseudomonas TaxID=196821 RepID=UPI000C88496F|nr:MULTISPECIES: DUF4160 domain-containing protein [unclassified Pseudomonas]PNA02402.1 hypothetical protein C1X79_02410 [Pseudomonas sp. FW305-42]PNA26513.1 hypothetical protein C1X78_05435 [Pseudomonas sp. MPR-R1B]PNB29072.1 hypothetical protein C1X80_01570 [Pseudomonas sp. DP16D-E2]PNB63843.1 hypothetical protein C1X77_05360 [Pseudomonas sp. GW531-E2]PNB69990.1 hypothetical protein C1X76_02660 [Pseudomonas sp. FW305-127]
MPTIQRLSDCSICMYAADHPPPHFHVRFSDGRQAVIAIEELVPLTGLGGARVSRRALSEVLGWASANKVQLLAKWKELNP